MEKRFISEKQLADIGETRRKERGAKEGDTEDEAPYDPRSLYERLQEQKDKKQAEHDELFAMKNQVSRITEDEARFLAELSDRRAEEERQRLAEDRALIDAYRKAVQTRGAAPAGAATTATPAALLAASSSVNPPAPLAAAAASQTAQPRTSAQRSLIARAVKRKAEEPGGPPATPQPPPPPLESSRPTALLTAYGTDSSSASESEDDPESSRD